MSKYKHIIWDWNGTLLDDAFLCVDILNEILGDHQLPIIDVEYYKKKFHFPAESFYEVLGVQEAGVSFEEVSNRFIHTYWDRWKICDLHPGSRDTFRKVAEMGLSQSVLSASKQEPLNEYIEHYRLESHFVGWRGIKDHYARGKVEEGKAWVEHLPYEASEVVFVGDTVHDHEVANEIGADCILIEHGHNSLCQLEMCNVPIVHSVSGVLDQILG